MPGVVVTTAVLSGLLRIPPRIRVVLAMLVMSSTMLVMTLVAVLVSVTVAVSPLISVSNVRVILVVSITL